MSDTAVRKSRIAQLRRCSGQVIALTAMLVPTLLGLLGLAVDGGMIFQEKRRMQAAADAGALGGAMEVFRRASETLINEAARTDARLNGFQSDVNATTVTVNHPPLSGPQAGNTRYVEVIISRNVKLTFLQIFSRQLAAVRARAVAGTSTFGDSCVLALNPTASGSLSVAGTATLNTGCGVMVNSTSSSSITMNGLGACINASYVGTAGSWQAGGGPNCVSPAPDQNVPPMLDPLSYLPAPTSSVIRTTNGFSMTGGVATLQPGVYQGGIRVNGGLVTFSPGIYIIDAGDFFLGGGTVANGNGVLFYITKSGSGGQWGTISIDGSATVSFSAPDSGMYEGVLFWADRNMPDRTNLYPTIVGTAASQFLGAIYAPSTQINYGGTNALTSWTILIGDRINITGSATTVNGNYDSTTVAPPTLKALLAE